MNRPLTKEERDRLIAAAQESVSKSACPHGEKKEGAALLDGNGNVYSGAAAGNVTAAKAAFSRALFEGAVSFRAVALAGTENRPAFPSGETREYMAAFAAEDFYIISVNRDGSVIFTSTLGELLPHGAAREEA